MDVSKEKRFLMCHLMFSSGTGVSSVKEPGCKVLSASPLGFNLGKILIPPHSGNMSTEKNFVKVSSYVFTEHQCVICKGYYFGGVQITQRIMVSYLRR